MAPARRSDSIPVVRHAVVKVPPVRNDVLSVSLSISPQALFAYERISFLLFVGEVVLAVPVRHLGFIARMLSSFD